MKLLAATMKKIPGKRLLFAGLFLFASAFFIHYLVKTSSTLHFGKDGGLASVGIFSCFASYIFFILLRRSMITLFGLGLFIGFVTFIGVFLSNVITWNPPDYLNFLLLIQIITDAIIFVIGICYLWISN